MDSTGTTGLDALQHALPGAALTVRAFLAPEPIPAALFGERTAPLADDAAEAVRSELGADESRRMAAVAMELLSDVFPTANHAFEDVKNWPLCAGLLPHIVTAAGHARRLDVAHEPAAFTLVAAAAYLMASDGSKDGAHALAERAHEIASTAPEPADLLVAEASAQMACIRLAQGDATAARELEEEALDIRVRVQGVDHPDTLGSMNNLAIILEEHGDPRGGHELREAALSSARRVLGEDDPRTLTMTSNLARSYFAAGDLRRALTLDERVLLTRRGVLGEEHPKTLASKSNLAVVLHALGDAKGARRLHEEVLEARVRVLGESHAMTVQAMSNLGATLHTLGERKRARELHERVAELMDDSPTPAGYTQLNNLAEVRGAHGDLDAARELHQQLLVHARETLGEEHPKTLTAMSNLAATLWHLGHRRQAHEMAQVVVAVRHRTVGPEHPDTLHALGNLAAMLAGGGMSSAARLMYEQLVATRREVLGERHPATIAAMEGLATVLLDLGKRRDAKTIGRRAEELGGHDPTRVRNRLGLGRR
jgi:tetratricopeptide (TPR) repeat protein